MKEPEKYPWGDLEEFIKLLYKDRKGDVELRALPSQKRMFTRKMGDIRAFCKDNECEDLYFGVATRKDKKGTKEGCLHIPALWVDIDFKGGHDYIANEVAVGERVGEGPLLPSIMIHSGGGIHLYFLLDSPIESNTILESILRAMAVYYHGDIKVAEVARILRLPGTFNHKYDPPRPVKILEMTDIRYSLESFEVFGALLPKGEERKAEVDWEKTQAGVAEGERNNSATQLAGKWFRQGLYPQQVMALLVDWNEKNNPPLPIEDLGVVVHSISKTSARNDPKPEITELEGITADDLRVVHHDLKHIQNKGLKSGYDQLDSLVGGVWRDGIVISGAPGSGKTIFALNLSVGFAEGNNRVIIFDLENDRRDSVKRLALIAFYRNLGKESPTEQEMLGAVEIKKAWAEAITKVLTPHVTLFGIDDDTKVIPASLDTWVKLASEEMARKGNQAILIIDSLNELASVYPLARGIYESLERWLAEIKKIRVKYQVPIMLICHVPMEHRAEIFNPKGSSGIAHFARTQIVIKCLEDDGATRTVQANVVRSQFGSTSKRDFIMDRWKLGMRELTTRSDIGEG